MTEPYRVIVIPDLQVPYVDKRSLAAVEKYMADEKWDEWVQIGDFMDLPQLSKFTKENPEALTQYHSRKMVDSYGVNIFYGHTHDVQSSSKVQWGKNKTLVGQSLGCLCRYDLDYVGTDPTNWQQAVTTFFFMPDGHFSYFISRIFNGRMVAPNGKIYG